MEIGDERRKNKEEKKETERNEERKKKERQWNGKGESPPNIIKKGNEDRR